MKWLFSFALFLLCFNANSQTANLSQAFFQKAIAPGGWDEPEQMFGAFKGVASDSNTYSNESFKGKITFINFWFKMCPPCAAEMDALNELYAKFKDDKRFQFLSLTFDSPEIVKESLVNFGIQYPVISMDKPTLFPLNYSVGFPTSVVIDGTGKIRLFKCGGTLDKVKAREIVPLFEKKINTLLKQL
jgi:thiol-disulfide isomerase/thioredoxin